MPTLQLEFNCLCLFVRDEPEKLVHVLMPATAHHHALPAGSHHPADGIDEHLVRLVHESFAEAQGRPLEGWALELGPAQGAAELETLDRPEGGPRIVDVTTLTKDVETPQGRKLKRQLVTKTDRKVASRFTLRSGRVTEVHAQADWIFKGEKVRMAHQVVWEIDDVPDVLPWNSLGARGGAPLVSLSALGDPATLPGGKNGYRLRVFHTTAAGLPPNDDPGALKPEEVRHHFGVFYEVLDVADPSDEQLPRVADESLLSDTVNCGPGQVKLAPPPPPE